MIEELRTARWFSGKSRSIRGTRVTDRARWADDASMALVQVDYLEGPPETYVLAERLGEPGVGRALLRQFHGACVSTEAGGSLAFRPTHLLGSVPMTATEPIVPMRGEQSNTSIRFGNALILKLFRRLQFGPNPDVEVGWFLTEHSQFRGTPALVGSLDYVSPEGQSAGLALLQKFEPNRGDAWTTTLQRVRAALSGADLAESEAAMLRLGLTTADLHLALAAGTADFAAEPIAEHDIGVWKTGMDAELTLAVEALAGRGIHLDSSRLSRRAHGIAALNGALKTRHHGDYHLGQVLERDDGSFSIIDFEGEPSRPLDQRREKRSPLRDVAGMLRSFDYARHAGLRAGDAADPVRVAHAADWYDAVRAAFLEGYLGRVRARLPALLPDDVPAALAALELEKTAYEVLYELNNRPDWLPIPLAALTLD